MFRTKNEKADANASNCININDGGYVRRPNEMTTTLSNEQTKTGEGGSLSML